MSSENMASKADSRLMRVNPGFIYENDPDIINNIYCLTISIIMLNKYKACFAIEQIEKWF